jgi:hypothetical protein
MVEFNDLLFFLGDEEADAGAGAHGGNKDIVADYVEFLLVVTSRV